MYMTRLVPSLPGRVVLFLDLGFVHTVPNQIVSVPRSLFCLESHRKEKREVDQHGRAVSACACLPAFAPVGCPHPVDLWKAEENNIVPVKSSGPRARQLCLVAGVLPRGDVEASPNMYMTSTPTAV